MLIELAVGDAYGAGFEFAPEHMIRAHNNLSGYIQHPQHGVKPGCYTDDTQMSVAIAEAVISDEIWTSEKLADRFVVAFKRDPREGYASRFYAFLQEVRDGTEFLSRICPDSDRSGAAMRSSPIGVYASVEEIIDRCNIQAAITHDTPQGMNAAVAAALMTHYFLYRLGPKASLGTFLAEHIPGPWPDAWRGPVDTRGTTCVHAAVSAVTDSTSMSSLLLKCVDFTGDVDTVGAIALAAASCSQEIEQDLPAHLVQGLENGPFGRDFLAKLDKRLALKVAAGMRVRIPPS